MYYTNTMKVTLKDAATASNALEIMASRLAVGFECDSCYKAAPADLMKQNLIVRGNDVVLPEDFGCYLPDDAETVICALMLDLAKHLSSEAFTCDSYHASDYDENEVAIRYVDGELKVHAVYYPEGYVEFLRCSECCAQVVRIEEYEEGKTYICPECGEELDLSKQAPVLTEKTFKIY